MKQNAIKKLADWPSVSLLFVIFLFCNAAFGWRQQKLGYENKTLDSRRWYTPSDVMSLMKGLGDAGRNFYATTELTLDFVFPFVYGGILVILMFRLHGTERSYLTAMLPVTAVLADVLENVSIAYLALSFAGSESPLAWFSATCTFTKWAALLLSIITISVLAVRSLRMPHPTP